MNRYSVDKIENELVELIDEDGLILRVKLEDTPQDIKEGDILVKGDDFFLYCPQETEKKKVEIERLLDELFEE